MGKTEVSPRVGTASVRAWSGHNPSLPQASLFQGVLPLSFPPARPSAAISFCESGDVEVRAVTFRTRKRRDGSKLEEQSVVTELGASVLVNGSLAAQR